MPRTIVYAPPKQPGAKGDGYTERLAKYIPGEVLAGFLPLTGLAAGRSELLSAALTAGAVMTLIYLFVRARQESNREKRPRPHFYAFALIAYLVWANGTSGSVQQLLGMDEIASRFWLAITVFAMPGIDLAIDTIAPRPKA